VSLLHIARLGDSRLRAIAQAVTLDRLQTPVIQTLMDDMLATLAERPGLGLTAPQVHHDLRIMAVALPHKGELARSVLINPSVTVLDAETVEDWEGCLSLPTVCGRVARPGAVAVQALDREGKPLQFELRGFPARVLQHQQDHLDGVLFVDRMRSYESLVFSDYAPPDTPIL
jgi:peptide deformylase